MLNQINPGRILALAFMSAYSMLAVRAAEAGPLALRDVPVFLNDSVAPLNMLVVGRDHKLYYEAYNDASDLDDDGQLDIRFKPTIEYYGYFDPNKCYTYSGTNSRFGPSGGAAMPLRTCSGSWSGNYLNYLTTARIDAVRKVLYGGRRVIDTATMTVLERNYIPQDAHSWGKEYTSTAVDGFDIAQYAPLTQPAAGRRHLFANTTLFSDAGQLPRLRVTTNVNATVSDWLSIERPVADNFYVNSTGWNAITPTDYIVRVQVCVTGMLESNCRPYPNGGTKPTGLLQDYGENSSMLFGLLTGSFQKNTEGGVLRKKVGTFTDELNTSTGQFTKPNPGIIRTLDGLRVWAFNSGFEYTDARDNCGWISDGPITAGRCQNWGNPVGEMMYEALRYFAGKGAPTPDFDIAASGNADAELGLTRATWDNPYATGKPTCAKPFMTVVSDINPSYDTDKVPGTVFGSFSGDLTGLNAAARGDAIWTGEFGGAGNHFIGQSGTGTFGYDGSPSPKTVSSLGNIRGLAPEEPTKQGGYYAASVAYFGATADINPAPGSQRVETFAVALASPLPRIEIPVGGGKKVTLVPFAKSSGGCLGIDGTQGNFQPTNQIVDFYVESVAADGSSGSFRVNFEDVEQGADHDMDAIVRYTYQVVGGQVRVDMQSLYAAGCIVQHMGYVISGTTSDGTYLEVRDLDTGAAADQDYFLDTPPGSVGWNDGQPLPLTSTRLFTPGSASGATLLEDPLWFAAKWGGFQDSNENNVPDLREEWDSESPGQPGYDTPDNYFLVTNALNLRNQLAKAFDAVLSRSASTSSAAVNSGTIRSNTRFYQAEFNASVWSGNLRARPILSDGTIGPLSWSAATVLPAAASRKIATRNTAGAAVPFTWTSLDTGRRAELNPENVTATGQARVDWLRGVRTGERRNGGAFRDRDPLSALGDIINSAPAFLAQPAGRYADSLESAPYSTFKSSNASRQAMIYIGGNDGMLHAFDADTGVEQWAFIPGSAFSKLKALTDINFQHKFILDGSPSISDAFWSGSWKTVAVTSLGQGAQSVFAMNVTTPTAANEAAVASKFIWEFTDANDTDLGFVTGKPVVARMKNGKWVAIFGNGYNNTVADGRASTTGNGVLYVVDMANGAIIKKFDTRVGMAADPLGQARPNGLAAPAVIDIDDDNIVDFIYVGDLFGNLWKIDVRATSESSWNFSFLDASSNPLPLHIARGPGSTVQPITSRPTVGTGPYGEGYMVYFGTGKFLETADRTLATLTTQSLYGVIDRNTGTAADRVLGRTNLTQQTIDLETTVATGVTTTGIRVTSANPLGANRGWYLDLISPGPTFVGEMQVTDSVLRNGRIFFTTLVPNPDPCGFGGDSWLVSLDALSGARLDSTFDLNGDGKFNNSDLYDQAGTLVAVSATKSGEGIAPRPTVVTNGEVDYFLMPGTRQAAEGEPDTGARTQIRAADPGSGAYGRQSWRQLR